MAYDSIKTIRVDGNEWDNAKQICDDLHLSMSALINMLIKQVIIRKGIPMEVAVEPTNGVIDIVTCTKAVGLENDADMSTEAPLSEGFPVDNFDCMTSEHSETPEGMGRAIDLEEHNRYKTYIDSSASRTSEFVIEPPPVVKKPIIEKEYDFHDLM